MNNVYTWEHVLLCVWWVVYCEAGCPGRTGARRPPCATSPVHRASVQRSAERFKRTERFRSSGLTLSHANISGGFSRGTRGALTPNLR